MNVLVYVMDALRADFLSCYGHEYETTPEIDAFASDAVRFTNAYSTATWTKPAATSLLTGRQPRALNMLRLMDRLPDVDHQLPRVLGEAGFDTHAVSANTFVSAEFGFAGFDSFDLLQTDPEYQRERRTAEARGQQEAVLDELGLDRLVTPLSADVNDRLFDIFDRAGDGEGGDSERGEAGCADHDPESGSDEREAATGDGDVFALAWSIDTHGPYYVRGEESAFGNDPSRLIRESEVSPENVDEVRSLYRDMIRYNDRQFGALLDRLRESGQYDETMIVVLADHGESFGDHGKFLGRPIFGHSGVVYEEVVRVPMLIKFPDGEFGGSTVDGLTQITDVYPTITDVCGVDTPPQVDGRSLYPPGSASLDERTVFVESQPNEESVYSGAVRRGDHKLLRIRKDWRWRRNWRRMAESLLWKLDVPNVQLFDLATDPNEQIDRSADRPAVTAELTASFEAIRDRLDDEAATVSDVSLTTVTGDTERDLKALGYLD